MSQKAKKCTIGIRKRFSNIGGVIEYVMDHNVGADSWRRTGVLTFDGNTNLQKVTYKTIQENLKKTFSTYGTAVELCISHNKQRSAERNRGFAKVTTRRAHKDLIYDIILMPTGVLCFIKDFTKFNMKMDWIF